MEDGRWEECAENYPPHLCSRVCGYMRRYVRSPINSRDNPLWRTTTFDGYELLHMRRGNVIWGDELRKRRYTHYTHPRNTTTVRTHSSVIEAYVRFRYDVAAFAAPSPIVENITSNRYSVSFGCHASGLSAPSEKLLISLGCLEGWKLTTSAVNPDVESSTRSPPHAERWCVGSLSLSNLDKLAGEKSGCLAMVCGRWQNEGWHVWQLGTSKFRSIFSIGGPVVDGGLNLISASLSVIWNSGFVQSYSGLVHGSILSK